MNQFNPQSSSNKFKRYFKNPGSINCISDNIIWRLKRSDTDENIIWIGTANGLTKYNTYTETFSQIKIPNPERLQFGNSAGGVIEETSINNEKILWIDSYAGLVRLNISDGNAVRFIKNKNNPNSISSTQVHKIFKDRSGVIWIATDKGLNYFSLKNTKFNYLFSEKFNLVNPAELNKKNIKAIAITSDNTTRFGTDEGLYYSLNLYGKATVYKLKDSEKLDVCTLTADNSGSLWIGTYGSGLFKLNLKFRNLERVKMFSEWVNTQSVNFNSIAWFKYIIQFNCCFILKSCFTKNI